MSTNTKYLRKSAKSADYHLALSQSIKMGKRYRTRIARIKRMRTDTIESETSNP